MKGRGYTYWGEDWIEASSSEDQLTSLRFHTFNAASITDTEKLRNLSVSLSSHH